MIKTILPLLFLLLSCSPQKASEEQSIEVYFSPNGGAADAIIKEINSARKTIQVQAFSCTSVPIGDALVSAHNRKINVEVILDPENLKNPNSLLQTFLDNDIPVFIDRKHSIAHNKIILIDSDTVITGSYNLSKGAEYFNAENSLIIKNSKLAARYQINWGAHQLHSKQFTKKDQ